jgi:hypothetical protein
MFQAVGERLNSFTSWFIKVFKKTFRFRKTDVNQSELVFVGGLLAFLIVFGGAAIFTYYEGWSYFNSIYYCVVTLTTIGFGDYVALQVWPFDLIRILALSEICNLLGWFQGRKGFTEQSVQYGLFGALVDLHSFRSDSCRIGLQLARLQITYDEYGRRVESTTTRTVHTCHAAQPKPTLQQYRPVERCQWKHCVHI